MKIQKLEDPWLIMHSDRRCTSILTNDTCGDLFVHWLVEDSLSLELFANRLNQHLDSQTQYELHRCLFWRALHVTSRLFIIRYSALLVFILLCGCCPPSVRLFGSDLSHPLSTHHPMDQKRTECAVSLASQVNYDIDEIMACRNACDISILICQGWDCLCIGFVRLWRPFFYQYTHIHICLQLTCFYLKSQCYRTAFSRNDTLCIHRKS